MEQREGLTPPAQPRTHLQIMSCLLDDALSVLFYHLLRYFLWDSNRNSLRIEPFHNPLEDFSGFGFA